jgi:hypothetical protein
MKQALTLTVDQLLDQHVPPVQAIAQRLRELVRRTVPEAKERVYPGWHAVGYVHPEAGYFGAIFPREDQVKLCFEWGAELPNPHHILTGNQKRVRYVVISDELEIPESAIVEMIQAAMAYQLTS